MKKYRVAAHVIALLALAGCGVSKEEPASPEPTVQDQTIVFPSGAKTPRLETQAVEVKPAPNIQLNGRVVWDENRTVRLYTPFAGRVARILVQPGDSARKGQALAILGSPDFGQAQAEAHRAESDVGLAEKNLQRLTELEGYGVAPRKDLQVAEAEYGRARAELERARGRVRLYGGSAPGVDQAFSISSPIQGVVVERNINPGQEVRPDQMTSNAPPLFVITDPTHLWVLLDATEKDLGSVSIGQLVNIRSPVFRDRDFVARIASISDFLDPATRTLKVRATLENANRQLKAEMFVTAEVQTRQGLRMQVPAKSVFFQAARHYAFTDEGNGKYVRREVTVGDEQEGVVEIRDGLRDGQRVVVEDVLMLQQMLQPRRVQK